MTTKKRALPLSLLSLLTALLGACSSTPIATPAPAAKPLAAAAATPSRSSAPPAASAQVPASAVATVSLPEYLDPKSAIATGRSVYFDYDVAALKPDASPVIERHGKYLIANPKLAIKIEGNTDERGSAEYNLALGQKRAEAVRQALKIYGVKETQIEATSWGSEKPKAQGHDESAWAQNRRADLQYPSR
jgi:peptidoglycan-associated lipoprotein